jgi:hypothetical protein
MDKNSAPAAGLVLSLAAAVWAQDCEPGWGLGYPNGTTPPICRSLLVVGEGDAQVVYAGTETDDCCGGIHPGIIRWDGRDWAPVDGGVHGELQPSIAGVRALTLFDDGAGARLFIGGVFTHAGGTPAWSVASLDEGRWAPLGEGLVDAKGDPGHANAMAVFDDGSGPALYVAGQFALAGGQVAVNIARWDGHAWSSVGLGIGGEVRDLEVYGEGEDARLYAAGSFNSADYKPASGIAAWDGEGWAEVGGGAAGTVYTLEVFDDGDGPLLIAGGEFGQAGGQAVNSIAAWDGAQWSPLGKGLEGGNGQFGRVTSLEAADLGEGLRLFAAGRLVKAGDAPAEGMAWWDGQAWAANIPGFSDPNSGGEALAMAAADFGGPVLIMGGVDGGASYPDSPTLWDGRTFRAMGEGATGTISMLISVESGEGPVLYAGGGFWGIGGIHANNIAALGADGWRALGAGIDNNVLSAVVFDDGRGEALYIAGGFDHAGGKPASSIARWDGQNWSAVGNPSDGPNDFVRALAVYDDGRGPGLYATGYFSKMGGKDAAHIARWDGTKWWPVGGGLSEVPHGKGGYCLAVYDDGGGPELYVGGAFGMAGDQPVLNIARWNGSAWAAVGPGLKWLNHPADQAYVMAMTVHDEGDGPRLFAAGAFSRADDLLVRRIARWDGQQWSAVGDGFDFTVHALHSFDDGGGPALFAGGNFGEAVGFGPAAGIARWRDGAWSPLGDGLDGLGGNGYALASHDFGGQPALMVGGSFKLAGGRPSDFIARYNACPSECAADCDQSTGAGNLDIFDFLCFVNAFNAGEAGADCTADGGLDIFDFLCFVNAFNGGCP